MSISLYLSACLSVFVHLSVCFACQSYVTIIFVITTLQIYDRELNIRVFFTQSIVFAGEDMFPINANPDVLLIDFTSFVQQELTNEPYDTVHLLT